MQIVKWNVLDAFSILRDHGSSDYSPDSHFLMNHVCAHSANKIARNASQSTASLVASNLKRIIHFLGNWNICTMYINL